MENNLKILRAKHNYTQQKLSEALGVSRQTIYMIEQGRYNPSLELAFKLSKLFEEKIENIFIHSWHTLSPVGSIHEHHMKSYR